jgi:hypothetical protein
MLRRYSRKAARPSLVRWSMVWGFLPPNSFSICTYPPLVTQSVRRPAARTRADLPRTRAHERPWPQLPMVLHSSALDDTNEKAPERPKSGALGHVPGRELTTAAW